jgi:hypothetical protein
MGWYSSRGGLERDVPLKKVDSSTQYRLKLSFVCLHECRYGQAWDIDRTEEYIDIDLPEDIALLINEKIRDHFKKKRQFSDLVVGFLLESTDISSSAET